MNANILIRHVRCGFLVTHPVTDEPTYWVHSFWFVSNWLLPVSLFAWCSPVLWSIPLPLKRTKHWKSNVWMRSIETHLKSCPAADYVCPHFVSREADRKPVGSFSWILSSFKVLFATLLSLDLQIVSEQPNSSHWCVNKNGSISCL